MNAPYIEIIRRSDEYHALFAFQVIHRSSAEWLAMRWGFNASALLEEALERYKLFIASQSLSEVAFLTNDQPDRTLTMRGINLPGEGILMALLGKTISVDKKLALQAAENYARELYSIFPHDFILRPTETRADFDRFYGRNFFAKKPHAASIQRGMVYLPSVHNIQYVTGLWQAGSLSNEQVWRALSNMRQTAILNIILQPSLLFEGEKKMLLEVGNKNDILRQQLEKMLESTEEMEIKKEEKDIYSVHMSWVNAFVERRLALWKKFFNLQIHLLVDGAVDENLLRSIGSAFTCDTDKTPSPGFQVVRPVSAEDEQSWLERICSLELLPPSMHIHDLADLDETFSVFRFPYRPEAGLPGANFIPSENVPPPT